MNGPMKGVGARGGSRSQGRGRAGGGTMSQELPKGDRVWLQAPGVTSQEDSRVASEARRGFLLEPGSVFRSQEFAS